MRAVSKVLVSELRVWRSDKTREAIPPTGRALKAALRATILFNAVLMGVWRFWKAAKIVRPSASATGFGVTFWGFGFKNA